MVYKAKTLNLVPVNNSDLKVCKCDYFDLAYIIIDSKRLYDKSPILDDVVAVVTEDCDSQTFREHLKLLSDCDLKTAFSHWIRTEPTHVTWRNLLKALRDTSKKQVVKYIINDYLKRPSVYKRYISKPDYNPMDDFDL